MKVIEVNAARGEFTVEAEAVLHPKNHLSAPYRPRGGGKTETQTFTAKPVGVVTGNITKRNLEEALNMDFEDMIDGGNRFQLDFLSPETFAQLREVAAQSGLSMEYLNEVLKGNEQPTLPGLSDEEINTRLATWGDILNDQ